MNEQHDHRSADQPIGDLPLGAAFDERATHLSGRSARGVADVRRRLERRRQQRRALTGAGAAAVLLVGVGGLYLAGQRGDETPATRLAAPTVPATTVATPIATPVWRCAGPVDPPADAPDGSYFSNCEMYFAGGIAGDPAVDPATTAPATITPTTLLWEGDSPSEDLSTTTAPLPPAPDLSDVGPVGPDGGPSTVPPESLQPGGQEFASSGVVYYVVKDGDSLASITNAFQTTLDALVALNGWSGADQALVLVPGDPIKVPAGVSIEGGLPPVGGEGSDPAIGLAAPIVNGVDFDGNPVQIDAVASGRPTLVVSLAHWCPHCDSAIGTLLSLETSGRLPAGLDVIGVSGAEIPDGPNWPPVKWLADSGWNFPVVVDPVPAEATDTSDPVGLIAQAFGVQGYPTMTLIGADGNVLDRWTGELTADEIAQRLVPS